MTSVEGRIDFPFGEDSVGILYQLMGFWKKVIAELVEDNNFAHECCKAYNTVRGDKAEQ